MRPMSESSLGGYTLLNDIYGKLAFILKVNIGRSIYQQGQLGQMYFMGALLLGGIVVTGVVQFLLEKSVVSRLVALHQGVAAIATSGDSAARVDYRGRDEIAHLGYAINYMLESLQVSQKQNDQVESRHRAFMNNIPCIASIMDREGRLFYMNEPMIRIFNIDMMRLRGKKITEWMPAAAVEILQHNQEVLSKTLHAAI